MSTNTKKIDTPQQIDLIDLFFSIIRRWYLLAACTVIGAVLMGYATNVEVMPLYTSSSVLFVAKAGTITSFSDLQIGSYMTEDFIVIAKSKPVIDTTIQKLYEMDGVNLSRSEASGAISVSEIEDTHMIQFSVTYSDPQIACDLCNALTDTMADQIAYIMTTDRPTIVENAEVSNYPINIQSNDRQIMIGALGGFAICAAFLCAIYLLDDNIKTEEDVEKYLDATVLVTIPLDKNQTFKKSKKASKAIKKK